MKALTTLLACAISLLIGCQGLIGLKDRMLKKDGGTGGTSAGAAGQTATSVTSKACKTYCDNVLAACTDTENHSQYYQQNRALCENVCGILEQAGKPAATTHSTAGASASDGPEPTPDAGVIKLSKNNTVECRAKQALNAAQIEPEVQCPFAGPGGADTCGSNCESYCYLMSHACAMYPGFQVNDCVTKCGALRDLGNERLKTGESSLNATRDHEGDTVQCRLVHVSAASVSPETHCWHAQLAPRSQEGALNPCAGYLDETAPRCEDYCRINAAACPKDLAVYESTSQCMAVCSALIPGTLLDDGSAPNLEDNNNMGCRKSHSYSALIATPEVHCPHSGPGGAGVCGSNCASYCRLLEQGCGTQFKKEFGTSSNAESSCEAACDKVGGNDYKNYSVSSVTTSGGAQTFGCRMLAVTRALGTPTEPAFCEAALGHTVCP